MGNERDDDILPDDEDSTLSALADAVRPEPPPPELRQRLLGRLRSEHRYDLFCHEVSEAFAVPEDVVRESFARIHDDGAWQPGGKLGGTSLIAPALTRANVVIARIPPGTRIPKHDHKGIEQTYVLDGAIVEEGSRTLTAGHLLVVGPGHEHALKVVGDEPCLVVFAASREG